MEIQRSWLIVIVVAVLAIVCFFFGVFHFLFNVFIANPVLLIGLAASIVIFLAWRSGNSSFVKAGLAIVMISIASDIYLPSYSATCFAQDNSAALSFIQNYPASAFADDTALCKLWIDVVGWNPALVNFQFPEPIPIAFYVCFFFSLAAIVLALLAFFVSPKLWTSCFFLLIYALMVIFLFDGQTFAGFVLTPASFFTYLFMPLLLLGAGFWLLFSSFES